MRLGIYLAAALLLFQATSFAASKAKKPVGSKDSSHLGTSFRFDGSALHGKYQTSPSTTATVENDKFLEDLLGARKQFDDREKKDQSRN